MSGKRQHKDSMTKHIIDAVAALDAILDKREVKSILIEKDYPDERLKIQDYNDRKQRLASIDREFENAWVSSLKQLDELCKRIRKRQPHLNELCIDSINTGSHFPDALAFGRIHLKCKNWRGYIPRMVPFPFKNSLWIPDKTDLRLTHQLLLRIIHAMPIGSVEITACDPLRLGTSLHPFLSLLNVKRLFPDQRLLTRSDEIERALAHIMDYVENLIQNKFKKGIQNWITYNSVSGGNPLPYKILFVFGVPDQLTEKSVWYLDRLVEHGPTCGVLPVLTVDEERMMDRKFNGLRSVLEKHSKRMDAFFSPELLAKHFTHIAVTEESEFWPHRSQLADFLKLMADKYEQVSKFGKYIAELWNEHDTWAKSTVQGIHVPIGWSFDGETITLSVGGVNTEHHVLLAGSSGSGKSNLLHVLIHCICHSYSPSELNVYLLDYKQGTEFNIYSSPPLPQAKLVATESDPEYGVTVLSHLLEEIEKRAAEFKKRSVREFSEYRTSTSNDLPRILLIIDEFQILFSEGRQVSEPAEKMLNQLLRQGRAYGIHVLLATQTLRGIQSISMGQLTSQIGCRIALSSSEEDSALVLGSGNWEAARLNSPPEGIINDSYGAKSANQLFFIPFADRELCRFHIESLAELALRKGYGYTTKVFNGSRLPAMPSLDWFESKSGEGIRLHLGEKLCFEEESLEVAIHNRPSSNLLISGYNDAIHDGLLMSIHRSLLFSQGVDEIIYFDGRYIESVGVTNSLIEICGKPVFSFRKAEDINFVKILDESLRIKRVLIIDGLDSAKSFHSLPVTFRPVKNDEPPSLSDSFKKILEEGPSRGIFVIAFIENWRRCFASCKDVLSYFELRVGFCMNEDDAGSLVGGGMVKFKGLETDTRAVFTDYLKNLHVFFRPYICDKEL